MTKVAPAGSKYWWVLGAVASVAIAGPKDARACQPQYPSLRTVIPSDGGHPANAAILLSGSTLDAFELVATIDGSPSEIVVDDSLSQWDGADDAYKTLALRLEPEPVPGQTVNLTGNPCKYFPEEDERCDSFEVTYVAEENDQDLPVAPDDWWWDAVLSANPPEAYPPNGACEDISLGTVTVTYAFGDLQGLEDSGALLVRTWSTPESSSRDYMPKVGLVHAGMADSLSLPVFTDQAYYPVEESPVCVQLEVVDLAGHSSGVSEECQPCSARYALEDTCYPASGHCASTAPEHVESEDCYALPGEENPPTSETLDETTAGTVPLSDAGPTAEDALEDTGAHVSSLDASVASMNVPDEGRGEPSESASEGSSASESESESGGSGTEPESTQNTEWVRDAGAFTEHGEPDSKPPASRRSETDAGNGREPQLHSVEPSNDGGCSVAAEPLAARGGSRAVLSVLALALTFSSSRRSRREAST